MPGSFMLPPKCLHEPVRSERARLTRARSREAACRPPTCKRAPTLSAHRLTAYRSRGTPSKPRQVRGRKPQQDAACARSGLTARATATAPAAESSSPTLRRQSRGGGSQTAAAAESFPNSDVRKSFQTPRLATLKKNNFFREILLTFPADATLTNPARRGKLRSSTMECWQ